MFTYERVIWYLPEGTKNILSPVPGGTGTSEKTGYVVMTTLRKGEERNIGVIYDMY